MSHRATALEFVRQLLSRGYTVERAQHESLMGYDACDGSDFSYEIRRGVIKVPVRGGDKFSFATLAKELETKSSPLPPPVQKSFEQLALL